MGVADADVTVCLTDGGAGLEDCLIDALGDVAKQTFMSMTSGDEPLIRRRRSVSARRPVSGYHLDVVDQ